MFEEKEEPGVTGLCPGLWTFPTELQELSSSSCCRACGTSLLRNGGCVVWQWGKEC